MLVNRDEEGTDEHSAGDNPERVYCTAGRWSPRTLVHTVPQMMPKDVCGLVLRTVVSTEVVTRLKALWSKRNNPLKFTAVNFISSMRSTENYWRPNKMSGMFRIGRTTVMEVGRVNGPS